MDKRVKSLEEEQFRKSMIEGARDPQNRAYRFNVVEDFKHSDRELTKKAKY